MAELDAARPRSYTVKEIDGMRSAICERWQRQNPCNWRGPTPEWVEGMIRTYMEGGIDPSELYDDVENYPPVTYQIGLGNGKSETWVADDWVRPDGKPRNKRDHGPKTAVEYCG